MRLTLTRLPVPVAAQEVEVRGDEECPEPECASDEDCSEGRDGPAGGLDDIFETETPVG